MIKEYIQYLKDNPEGYWFKAKWFGWGWTPAKWQGWATILIYVAILAKIFMRIDKYSHSGIDTLIAIFVPFIILTVVFFAICFWKGEKPHWSWGDPRKKLK